MLFPARWKCPRSYNWLIQCRTLLYLLAVEVPCGLGAVVLVHLVVLFHDVVYRLLELFLAHQAWGRQQSQVRVTG